MVMVVAWAAVTLGFLFVLLCVERLIDHATGLSGARSLRSAIWCAAACVVGLIVLGLAYQLRPVASADARIVDVLADARSDALVATFRVVTTMGDVVPSFLIAAVLTVWLWRLPMPVLWSFLLPSIVLVQLALQFGYSAVFPVLAVEDVLPGLPIDGSGTIPSGSVARLLSLFVVAALICHRFSPGRGTWLIPLGSSLVLVELATRLLLGRHLLADILGGFLLGVLLSLSAAAMLGLLWERSGAPSGRKHKVSLANP